MLMSQTSSMERTVCIFKTLNYCFEETIRFDVKVSLSSRPVSRLTRWYNKIILRKGYSVPLDFLWIENYKLRISSRIFKSTSQPFASLSNLYRVAVVQRCSLKKVFLEISQNSQENTCARVCNFIRPATLLKKRPWHRFFPVNFVKFLRTHFFIEHLWWLLLQMKCRW